MYVDCGVRLPTPAVAGTVSASRRVSRLRLSRPRACSWDMEGACACVVGGDAGFRRAGPRVATRTSRPRPRRTDSPPRPPRYPVEAPFNWRRYYRYGHTKRQYRPAARRSKSDHGIRLLVWFYDCARDAIINLWGQYPAPTGAFGELFSRTEDCAPRPRARGSSRSSWRQRDPL